MKAVLTKMAVLFGLLMALTSVVQGTASAQSVPGDQLTTSDTTVLADNTQACGWVKLASRNWQPQAGNGIITIILWDFTCNGGVHCEAVDVSFHGAISHNGIDLQTLTSNKGNSPVAHRFPFAVGNILNTNTVGGASGANCAFRLTTS